MVSVDITQFDQDKLTLLKGKIDFMKENIIELADGEVDHRLMIMRGSRFDNSERIARTVVGKLYAKCKFDIELAKKMFLEISSLDIEPFIIDSVKESASADYYYNYEKDY